MNLTMAVICDEARERPDGRFDIVGVYSELSAPGFPAIQERMTVVFVIEWAVEEAGTQVLRADLTDADGQRILTIEGETEVSRRAGDRPPAMTRMIMPLEQVIFPRAGRYRFDLVAGGDVHPACSLFVGQPAESGRAH